MLQDFQKKINTDDFIERIERNSFQLLLQPLAKVTVYRIMTRQNAEDQL